jgi:hypothetical protein
MIESTLADLDTALGVHTIETDEQAMASLSAALEMELYSDDEKHALRLKLCGSFVYRLDPASGTGRYYQKDCGLFRECPRCADKRTARIVTDIRRSAEQGKVWSVVCTEEEDKSMRRKYGKAHYKRLPQADGTVMYFIESDTEVPGSTPLAPEDIDLYDWHSITQTPTGSNLSGGLGTAAAATPAEDTIRVHSSEICTDAPLAASMQCLKDAEADTEGLNPKDAEQLEEALEKRLAAFEQRLVERGYSILFRNTITLTVQTSRISWLTYEKSAVALREYKEDTKEDYDD